MRHLYLKPKGITLVEMIVYMAIFGIIFLSIIQFVLSVVVNNQRATQRKEMERVTTFIVEHIEDSFSKASSVDIGNSLFSVQVGRVRLSNGGAYYEYSINNNQLQFNNSGVSNLITNPDVKITQFLVDRINNQRTGLPDGIRLTLGIESNKDIQVKKTITTAFTLR